MDGIVSPPVLRSYLRPIRKYCSVRLGSICLGLLVSFWFLSAKKVAWYKAILGSFVVLLLFGGILKVCKYLINKYLKEDPEPLKRVIVDPRDNPELLHAIAKETLKMAWRRMASQRRTRQGDRWHDMRNSLEREDSHVNTVSSQRSVVLSRRLSIDTASSSQSEESDVESPTRSPSMASGSITGWVNASVKLQTNERVENADWPSPPIVTQGCQVVHMRFEIQSQSRSQGEGVQPDSTLARQISDCMTIARTFDEDFTLQWGSAAVLKSTASGPKKWDLQQNWTPTIIDIRRSWRLRSLLKDDCTTWTIRGLNLEGAILKASSSNHSEPLNVLERRKIEWELDEVVCEEPAFIQQSAPWFQDKIYILASKSLYLEEITCILHSEPINVKKPYWISVVDGLTPDAQVMMMMGSLSLASTLVSFLDLSWGSIFSNMAMIQSSTQSFFSNSWRTSKTLWLVFLGTYCSILGALFVLAVTQLIRTGDFIFYPGNWKKPWTALMDDVEFLSGGPRKKPSSPRALPRGITQLNDSVWELYSPTGKPEMEIIFFHGLQLDHFEDAFWKTWLVRDNEQMVWPKEWLSKTFPNARIMSVAYNSCALKTVGRPDHDVVNALGKCLVRDIIVDNRYNVGQDCPVFLVGHSLGGIVMKQFVLTAFQTEEKDAHNSANFERFHTFLENIRGMFYYSTPHGDSRIRELASQIQSRSPILELLKTIDRESGSIKKQFRNQRAPRNAHGFAVLEGDKTYYRASNGEFSDAVLEEELTRKGIDTGFSEAFSGTVVEEGSARENVDRCFTLKTANHFTVCRPQFMNDPVIGQLTGFIANSLVNTQGLIADAQESDLNRANNPSSDRPRATTVSDEEQTHIKITSPVLDLNITSASVPAAPAINRLNERLWEIPSQPWIEVLCFYGRQPGDFGIDAQMNVQENFRKYLPTARTLIVFYYLERNTPLDMDVLGKNLGADVIRFQIGQNCPVLVVGGQVGVAAINKLSTASFNNNDDAGTIHRFLENCKNYNDLTLQV